MSAIGDCAADTVRRPHARPARRSLRGAGPLACVLALLSPPSAHAYDRQIGLALGAGYTGITGNTTLPPHALHVGVGVGVGLGDTWELRVRADYAHHLLQMNRVSGSLDLVYLLDVLSVVPYLGVSVGGAVAVIEPVGAPGLVRGDFLAGAVLGLDVLIGREWTVGVEIRPTFVPTNFGEEPMLLTVLARGQALFEM